MKNKLIIVIMAIMVITFTGCGSKKEPEISNSIIDESGEKTNNSENLNKDKVFDSYKISEISLKTENGINTLRVTIENISNSDTKEGIYNIVFTDSSEVEKSKIAVFIKSLKPGEKVEIKSSINIDVIDSYNFKLVKA